METTFSTGQYLIVDQLTYHFEEPLRGDVIVFRYPKDPSKFFIKRIIDLRAREHRGNAAPRFFQTRLQFAQPSLARRGCF